MPWLYDRRSKCLSRDADGVCVVVSTGYSGHGLGKDNPDMERIHDIGPIPAGKWAISSLLLDTSDHGPFVLRLAPAWGTDTFGRSGFLVHGDSRADPGNASLGCVILPRVVREAIWKSGDRELVVT